MLITIGVIVMLAALTVTVSVAVLDACGVPIRAVHPGRLHCPGSPRFDMGGKDLDGTVFIDPDFQGANEAI